MLAKENGSAVFHAVNIYDISENGDVFVSKQDLEDGSVLVKPESSDTFVVGKTKICKVYIISIKDMPYSEK